MLQLFSYPIIENPVGEHEFDEKLRNQCFISVCLCLLFFLILLLTGCGATKHIPQESQQTHFRDSVHKADSSHVAQEIVKDSVFIHDSVFVDRYKSNDTVFIEKMKFKVIYKDKEHLKTDTITKYIETLVRDTVSSNEVIVEEIRTVPKFHKVCTSLFWVFIVLFIGLGTVKIYKRIYGLKL